MKITKSKRRKKTRYLACSHKLKKTEKEEEEKINVPHLSKEIVLNILYRASADFLHNVARSVCKCWGMIISSRRFVEAHLSHSRKSMVESFLSDNSLDDYNVELRHFELKHGIFRSWRILEISSGRLMDCCVGLLLLHVNSCFHLINPVTKQHSKLPPGPPFLEKLHSAKIAYIAHSSEIKVICRYDSKISRYHLWSILTVGKNMSWKMLNHTLLKDFCVPESFVTPISIGGVVIYWTWGELHYRNKFWVIDVDDESVKSVDVPLEVMGAKTYFFIARGRDLYLILKFTFENVILKLKDLDRWEWVEVFRTKDINLEPFRVSVIPYYAWLEIDKVLIYSKKDNFNGSTRIMAYDFRSRGAFDLQMSSMPHLLNFMSHAGSLISF